MTTRRKRRLAARNEFNTYIKLIYGDTELDSNTRKLLKKVWDENPDFIRSTAAQKTESNPNLGPLESAASISYSSSAMPTTLLSPISVSDDFSGAESFNDAFGQARLKGLSQFKWRSTKSNPSGLYTTEISSSVASNNTPNTTSVNITPLITPEVKPLRPLPTPENSLSNVSFRIEDPGISELDRHSPYDLYFKRFMGYDNFFKYQQGGQLNMNEQQLQLAFIQFLAQKTGAKNQLELEVAILQMGEEGLRLAYAEFMQLLQQQQVQAAKFGAKLNYIKSLRGQCPEGYEISYYKVGGTLCKKCTKKQVQKNCSGDVIEDFKKTRKKAQGGGVNLNNGKCKKKENGGEMNSTLNPKSYSKMTLAKCGTKLKEACKGLRMEDGNKIKKKTQPKKDNTKLDPDTTRVLPNGKYPENWTADDKIKWERKWGDYDEGAHVSPPTKKATGGAVSGKKLCKKKATGGTVSTNKGSGWKPNKRCAFKG